MSEPDRYAVIGSPVTHSISPLIHKRFAEQTAHNITYDLREAPKDGFSQSVEAFFAEGGSGLNVTLPFKQQAYAFAKQHSASAKAAQAVNTLFVGDDGTLCGDNTDGIGLVADLRNNHRISVDAKRILILGAGGATRGIIPALFQAGTAQITCTNRTPSRVHDLLAGPIGQCGELIECQSKDLNDPDAFQADYFDGIINATSASLNGQLPDGMPQHLRPQWTYDLVYAATPTPFVAWWTDQNIASFDGFGMLIEQAAESFAIWRGVRPDTQSALAPLRAEICQS